MKLLLAAIVLLSSTLYVYLVGVGRDVSISEKTLYYDLDALTYEDMLDQISARGPKGHAAITEWNVSWDWKCMVSLDVEFTYPRHVKIEQLTAPQKRNWEKFLAKLRLHENMHKYDGVRAAQEVAENWCFGAKYIVKYWVSQSIILDLRTDHGRTDGVVLRL